MQPMARDDIVVPLPGSPKYEVVPGRLRAPTCASVTTPSLSISDHPSYIQAPWSRTHIIVSHQSSSQRPFVTAPSFYNCEALGSLRPGQDWIRLFSSRYVGLAVHVTLVGFAFYFFSYGYGRLLAEYLKANDEKQVQAAHYVLVWPQALSLIIGLVSDCFPMRGYRRKSYMVLGWALSLAMYLVIIVMDAYSDSGAKLYESPTKSQFDLGLTESQASTEVSPYAVAYLLVSLVAAVGIQISWLAAIALSVEYAQREQLSHRGRLQATLVSLYYAGGVAAQILTAVVISDGVNSDHLVSTMSVGSAAGVLACVSAIAIPFVLMCYHEEPFVNPSRVGMSVPQRLKDFWKFCHQNVVYRVLFFIILHLFVVGLFNQNARDAVQRWSGVRRKEALVVEVTRMMSMMLSIHAWKLYLRNVGWRIVVFCGSTFYLASYIVLTVFATYDVVRNEWFYGVMLTMADAPRAWLILYAVVLATEISDIGHEGVTVALAMSYQTLAGLAGFTLASIFPRLLGKVSMDDVKQDSAATRAAVIQAYFIIIAINVLSYPLIWFLPKQKLDAQQMRAFGGYNRYASTALLLTFAVLLCFNLAITLIVVL